MESLTGRLKEIERNIVLLGADPITQHGFTQIPNIILTDDTLSVGAKLIYAMLLKYMWGENRCFPGQLRLARDMGAGERSVRTYIKELEQAELLTVQQRGLGKTNVYYLAVTVEHSRRLRQQLQHQTKVARPDRQNLPVRTGKRFRS
jgi:hypothetical protein